MKEDWAFSGNLTQNTIKSTFLRNVMKERSQKGQNCKRFVGSPSPSAHDDGQFINKI